MKITRKQLRQIIKEAIINEADKTNDPAVQDLLKKAEFEKSKGRLFQGDIDAIKDMARNGYGAAEIKRVKRLRF